MPGIDYLGPAATGGWRRIASASWQAPNDPTIYGILDVDARAMLQRIEELRAAGTRLTVTHVVAKAVADALARHPELNVVFRRGRAWQRRSIDVFLHATVPGKDGGAGAELSGIVLRDADRRTLSEIAAEMERRVAAVRADRDPELARSRRGLARIPRPLLPFVMRLVRALTVEWNLDLRFAGIPADPFGSAAVTSVGMLGLDVGLAPLYPIGGPPMLFTVGEVRPRPVVDEEGHVVARPVLRLTGTFDHRLMDGSHLAALSRDLAHILERGVAGMR